MRCLEGAAPTEADEVFGRCTSSSEDEEFGGRGSRKGYEEF